jgi:hypothetical protein
MAKTTITGRLTFLGPSEIHGMLEIRKCRIEEEGQYGTVMEIAFLNGKGTQLDAYKVGDIVSIQAEIKGRKTVSNGREFYNTNINGWKVSAVGAGTSSYTPPPVEEKPYTIQDSYRDQVKSQVPDSGAMGPQVDDLPF